MDRLSLAVEPQPWEIGTSNGRPLPYGGGALVQISVNGEPLRELVRRCEVVAAAESGRSAPPGSYSPPWGYRFDRGLFFGQPLAAELRDPDGVMLMGCACGVVQCWPLVVRIGGDMSRVVWSSLTQPFRSEWDYSSLQPLIFERPAYEREVARAERRFAESVTHSEEQQRNYEQRIRVLGAIHPTYEWPDWATVTGQT